MPAWCRSRLALIFLALTRHLLVAGLALMPLGAQAQLRLSQGCPQEFSVVDIGVWGVDHGGTPTRLAGGSLLNIGLQDKAQSDSENAWITCYPNAQWSERASDPVGNPIPLVAHVVLPTLLGFTQYPSKEDAVGRIEQLFQNQFPNVAVSDVVFANGQWRGQCKLGQEFPQSSVFRDYACLISREPNKHETLFFFCRSNPHSCGYTASIGEGLLVYQQPWEYAFTQTASTLNEAAQSWIEFAATGQASIEGRRLPRE